MSTLIANCRTIVSVHLDLDEQQSTKAKGLLSDIDGLMKAS